MQIFRNININLYKMYFKDLLDVKNQYEYLKSMYCWNPKAVIEFEKGHFNPHNVSYKWMQNGISSIFFSFPDSDEDILSSPYLFDICYDNLKNTLYLTNSVKLAEVIYAIIFEPESSVEEPFSWKENLQYRLKQIYETFNSIQVLCTLLIYAQKQVIYTPREVYQIKNDFSYIKVYKKEIINKNFSTLLDDASEINMSQISVPSLIDSYSDFFKKNNKNSLINVLTENPELHLNLIIIDPALPNAQLLVRSYMYGDEFAGSTKVITDSINFAVDLKRQFPTQVTTKTVFAPMSYSFMQIKKKTSPSLIKIDIYTPSSSADERFSMIFNDLENKELYDYYSRTFYRMLYDGKEIV